MTSIHPGAWVFLSRMHQIAWKIKHGTPAPGTHGRPILKSMIWEGLLAPDFFHTDKPRDTKKNMQAVLEAMVDKMIEFNPEYATSDIVQEALDA